MSQTLPTKSELIEEVLWFSAMADQILLKVKTARARLEDIARAEYEVDGVRTTWGHPNGTQVPLALSSARYDVTDRKAWMDWVAARYPTEVERITQVRPAFEKTMLDRLAKLGADACTEDGEIPPGVTFTPGGAPRGISIRYGKGVKDALADQAAATIEHLASRKGDTAQ